MLHVCGGLQAASTKYKLLETFMIVSTQNTCYKVVTVASSFLLPVTVQNIHDLLLQIPFVRQAPMVTFRKPIGSVSVSGHKFVGAPVPCGVVITRKHYVEALSSDVEYLNSRDATIMGSRNGHAPLYLWYTLTKKGYEGMRKDVEKCLRNAHLLKVT